MLVDKLNEKYNIITISRRVKERFKELNLTSYSCDISDEKELLNTLEVINRDVGHCEYIINCAGVLDKGSFDEKKINDVKYSMSVNAYAPLIIIENFIGKMKEENYGRIINLTSGAPLNCFPGFSCYSASKATLNALSTTLSKELDEYNISINLMSPGPVRSEMSPDSPIEPEVCLPTVEYLLSGKAKGEHNSFYWLGYKIPLFPDLNGINWLEGIGTKNLEKVI
ncbi:SDR family oxidoreductase [Vibrio sp. 2-2(8)]|nr:SDR family oxidoreductase [Vibrio sp. 2-2(8)]